MKRPVIGVDFDDVVASFNQAFNAYMRATTGTHVKYENHTSFFFDEVYGIPMKEMMVHLERFCHGHHDNIVPVVGAQAGLLTLSRRYDLHLITSRCETLVDITCDWLSAHKVNVFTDYHFTNSTSTRFADRQRLKSEVCHAIGASVLIDDAHHNAEEVAKSGVCVIMPKRPWNSGRPIPDGVEVVGNWKRVPRIVEKLVAERV